MIGLALYFVSGYLVMNYGKPLHFAGVFVGLGTIHSLVTGTAIGGLILYAYTAFVFMVVERYSDRILAPIGVLIIGAAILIAAIFYAG